MADGILALNPLSYWAFPETSGVNAANATGGTRGVLVNGAAFTASGAQGRGVVLDGVNDLVSVAHSAAYALNTGAISLWFNPDALGRAQGLVSKNSQGLDAGGGFSVVLQADGTLLFQLESTTATFTIQSSAVASAGAWNNLVVSWGAEGMQLWLNGVLVGSNAYTGGLGTSSGGTGADDPLVFGANTANAGDRSLVGASDFFGGRIDEAVVLSRQPTAAEILAINLNGSVVGNANPVATIDALAILENAADPFGGNVLANDTDANADPLSVFAVKGATGLVGTAIAGTYGVLTLSADGTYTYALNSTAANVQALKDGQVVTDTFAYTTSDGRGGLSTASLVITINGQNDAPVVVSEARTIVEDPATATLTGNVLTNDRDLDGGVLVVAAVNGASSSVGSVVAGGYGAITIGANGAYTYTLANASEAVQGLKAGQVVSDVFTYLVSDGQGGQTQASVTITITGKNDAPVVVADTGAATAEVAPTTSGNVLVNDSDVDGDTLVVSAVKGAAANVGVSVNGVYGVLTLNANGAYTYTVNSTSAAVIALAPGQVVTDTFAYTANDGSGGAVSANLVISVTGVNNGPAAVNDARTIVEDPTAVTLTGNVLTNDTDPDGGTKSVAAVNGSGANVGAAVAGVYGALTVNADGTYSYTLANASAAVQGLMAGQVVTDTFVYTLSDGQGGTATANVVVTITGKNDAPTVVADTGAVNAAGPLAISGNVLTNDSDIDGNSLVVSAVNGAAARVGADVSGTYGVLRLNADGSYTYTLNPASAALIALAPGATATETFTYRASDGAGGTAASNIAFTVTGANDPPRPVNDARTTNEDAATLTLTGNVLTNDTDPDGGTVSLSAVRGSASNIGVPQTGTYGALTVNADGSYTYTLANSSPAVQGLRAGQTVTDSFAYSVIDGQGGSAVANVVVTISGRNDAPTITAATTAAVVEDTTLTTAGSVLTTARDVDVGDTLAVNLVNGAAANVGNPVTGTYGTLVLNADGSYVYTLNNTAANVQALNAGQTVTDTFTYRLVDGSGAVVSNSLIVSVAGKAENRPPAAVDDAVNGIEDVAATFDPRANDSDPDGDPLTVAQIAGQPVSSGQTIALSGGHSVTLNANGTLTVTPAANFFGNVAFSYVVSDGQGGTASATATVAFAAVNNAPVAAPVTASVSEDGPAVTIAASFTDADPGDTHSFMIIDPGSVQGGLTNNNDGTFTYDPVQAFQHLGAGQTATETFTYRVTDAAGQSSTSTVTVTITGQNDGPIAATDFAITQEDTPVTLNVLANDTDPDTGDVLVITQIAGQAVTPGQTIILAGGAQATLNANGTITYAPAANANGLASLGYTVSDGHGGTASALANVEIASVADPATISLPVWPTPIDATDVRINNVPASTEILTSVAPLANGRFVVTWSAFGQDGGGLGGTRAQIFGANGQEEGPEFIVNTTTGGYEWDPAVTPTNDGGFWIVWHTDNQDGSGRGIEAQRYAADGSRLGGEFRINVTTANAQELPSIATLTNGAVAIAWQSDSQDGSGLGIYLRLFNPDGTPITGEIPVNTYTDGSQFVPQVTALAGGGILVTWGSDNQDGSGAGIFGQRFDASGARLGSEFAVNTTTTGNQYWQTSLALANGEFIIAWGSAGQDGSDYGVFSQRFAADGTRIGGEVQVNTFTTGRQILPSAIALADGGYFISWTSEGQDGSGFGLFGQRFDQAGQKVGGEIAINTTTAGNQYNDTTAGGMELALTTDGILVQVFRGPDGVYMRRFEAANGFAGNEDSAIALPVSVAPGEAGDAVSQTVLSGLPAGSVLSAGTSSDGGTTWTFAGAPPANLTLQTPANYNGNFTLTVTATTQDGASTATSVATRAITVTPVNDAPVAINDIAITAEDTAVTINVLANDVDPDAGDTLTITQIGGQAVSAGQTITLVGGAQATLNANGTITYAPASNANGPTSFDYTVQDSQGASGTGTVNVDVAAVADPVTVGFGTIAPLDLADTLVNSATNRIERNPAVAMLSDGGYLVVWSATSNQFTDIYMQRYNADGSPNGGESIVNVVAPGQTFQGYPSVTTLVDGSYVVTWSIYTGPTFGAEIWGRHFNADGTPCGSGNGEFVVTAPLSAGTQQLSSVAALPDGGFVVAWESGTAQTGFDIRYQQFDAAHAAVGTPLTINQANGSDAFNEFGDITVLSDGSFVIVWETSPVLIDAASLPTAQRDVYARRVGADGQPVGDEFLISTTTAGDQCMVSVAALPGGGFVATWNSYQQLGASQGLDVFMQVFDSAGARVGSERLVNTITAGGQGYSHIVALQDGSFVVSWAAGANTTNSGVADGTEDIFAQRFTGDGQPIDDVVRINATIAGTQWVETWGSDSALAVSALGVMVQAFYGDGDVHLRRFDTAPFAGAEDEIIRLPVLIGPTAPGETVIQVVISGLPAGSQLSAGNANSDGTVWTYAGAPPSNLSLVPPTNYAGTFTLTVVATTQDGASTATTTATHAVVVSAVNDAPIALNDVASTNEDAAVTINVLANDTDPDTADTLTVTEIGGQSVAAGDTITLAGGAQATLNEDGTITYTPAANATGQQTFTYTVSDNAGETGEAVVGVDVAPLNDAPFYVGGSQPSVIRELPDGDPNELTGSQQFNVVIVFRDVDLGDTYTISVTPYANDYPFPYEIVPLPSQGVQSSFILRLTIPNAAIDLLRENQGIIEKFDVTVTDAAGASFTRTVTAPVFGRNDAPTLDQPIGDQAAVEGQNFSFALPGNAFSDVDAGDPQSFSATLSDGSALPAWLTFDPQTRTFSGTPSYLDIGQIEVRVTVTDERNATASDQFTLEIASNGSPRPFLRLTALDPTTNDLGEVHYQATFSTPTTGVTAASFNLVATGLTDAAITSVTPLAGGNNMQYLITVDTGTGDGTVSLTYGSAAADPAFAGAIATGSFPGGIVAADFNNDGNMDVAVAAFSAGTVDVALGQGNGGFAPAATYASQGSSPFAIAKADVDGDGDIDLAVANQGSGSVVVLRNDGQGVFAANQLLTGGGTTRSVDFGDFNGDGRPDLLTANDAGQISVALNNGTAFVAGPLLPSGGTIVTTVRAADLNGDGFMDVVSANFESNSVSVLLGNGDGTLQTSITTAVAGGPVGLDLADIDGDGDLDIVTANYSSASVTVLQNNGVGSFIITGQYAAPPVTYSVVLADLNNDTFVDIVATGTGGEPASVRYGTGNGNFGGSVSLTGYGSPGGYDLVVSDFNGDHALDIMTTNRASNSAALWLGTLFVSGPTYTIDKTDLPPLILDLNGDGVLLISGVRFDYDSDGAPEIGNWPSSQDGLLALDRDGDGVITSGGEISFVGDLAGAKSDLEGLRAFDTNRDGVFSSSDAQFGSFRIWQDANSDGVSDTSELRTLADAGIISIDLERSGSASLSDGRSILGYATVTLANGSTLQAADSVLDYSEQSGLRSMVHGDALDQHMAQSRAELQMHATGRHGAGDFATGFALVYASISSEGDISVATGRGAHSSLASDGDYFTFGSAATAVPQSAIVARELRPAPSGELVLEETAFDFSVGVVQSVLGDNVQDAAGLPNGDYRWGLSGRPEAVRVTTTAPMLESGDLGLLDYRPSDALHGLQTLTLDGVSALGPDGFRAG